MAAAAVIPQAFLSIAKSKPNPNKPPPLFKPLPTIKHKKQQSLQLVSSLPNEFDIIPVQSEDIVDHPDGVVFSEREADPSPVDQVIAGFSSERLSFEGAAGLLSATSCVAVPESGNGNSEEEIQRQIDRAINAIIVLAAGSFAITKLLTIDHDYWHVSFDSLSN